MSRHKAWVDVVLKLRSRLSKWKAKTLSIGGRLTLLKPVLGASPLYSMSIFKGDRTLRDAFPRMFALESVKQIFVAEKMVMPIDYSFRRPIRGGIEQHQFTDLASTMDSVSLSSSHDRWVCNLSGDGEFRVKEVRNFIGDLYLPSHPEPTRCVKYIPVKINIFAWRARRDCLPTRANLIRRGVTLESFNCPLCLSCEEDVHHVFFQCDLTRAVLRRVCRCDVDPIELTKRVAQSEPQNGTIEKLLPLGCVKRTHAYVKWAHVKVGTSGCVSQPD
nr:RNA-directed DNA polymerase, eukaryota [Tanacetum cinerariifolium]